MTKAEWSGWMQAVGSVLAIAASAWIVQLQHKNAIALQADIERKELKKRVFGMIDPVQKVHECSLIIFETAKARIPENNSFERVIDEMRQAQRLIPVFGYPEGTLIRATNLLHSEIAGIAIFAEQYTSAGPTDWSDRYVVEHQTLWEQARERMVDAINDELDRLTTPQEKLFNLKRKKEGLSK